MMLYITAVHRNPVESISLDCLQRATLNAGKSCILHKTVEYLYASRDTDIWQSNL